MKWRTSNKKYYRRRRARGLERGDPPAPRGFRRDDARSERARRRPRQPDRARGIPLRHRAVATRITRGSSSSFSPRAGTKTARLRRLLPVDPSITFRWDDGTPSAFERPAKVSRRMRAARTRLRARRSSRFCATPGRKYRIAFEKLVGRNVDNPVRWLGALTSREMRRTSVLALARQRTAPLL